MTTKPFPPDAGKRRLPYLVWAFALWAAAVALLAYFVRPS